MVHKIYTVGLQITTKCNRSCMHCMGDYGPHKISAELPKSVAKNYIDQFPKHEVESLCITGGEPTLYKDLPEIIKYAAKTKERTGFPKKITMITNSSWASINDIMSGEDAIRYLVSMKLNGLDEINLSYDQFRTEQDRKIVQAIYNALAIKQSDGDEKILFNGALPKINIQEVDSIAPIGRGANLPKELWSNMHDNRRACCSLDNWAMYTLYMKNNNVRVADMFKRAPVVTVTPFSLNACSAVTEVVTMGKLGEDLDVVPERVKRLADLFVMMAAEGPVTSVKHLKKFIDIPDFEHSCQLCEYLFEKADRKEIEKLCEDGSMADVLDEIHREKLLAPGHS